MDDEKRLVFALTLQRLYELYEIQRGIPFRYQHKNFNKAAAQIDVIVDKILHDSILNSVEGTVSLKNPNVDHIITEALTSQQKMLLRNPNQEILRAVEKNIQQYNSILQNRIEQESISLQAKIEEEYRKKKYNNLSESEAKSIIREKFQEHGRKRARNIVKDALHTNQQQINYLHNLANGSKYKIWMNGQGKARVRPWHRAKLIQSVEIDDYFDIFGSFHARVLYPGDLNGGAENVANCRCWLQFSNTRPSDLKRRGTVQINPNVKSSNDNKETFSANTESKGKKTRQSKDESTSSTQNQGFFKRVRNRISNSFNKLKKKILRI